MGNTRRNAEERKKQQYVAEYKAFLVRKLRAGEEKQMKDIEKRQGRKPFTRSVCEVSEMPSMKKMRRGGAEAGADAGGSGIEGTGT